MRPKWRNCWVNANKQTVFVEWINSMQATANTSGPHFKWFEIQFLLQNRFDWKKIVLRLGQNSNWNVARTFLHKSASQSQLLCELRGVFVENICMEHFRLKQNIFLLSSHSFHFWFSFFKKSVLQPTVRWWSQTWPTNGGTTIQRNARKENWKEIWWHQSWKWKEPAWLYREYWRAIVTLFLTTSAH